MNKNRLKLIAVIAAFIAPILIAFLMQPLKDDLVKEGTINHGKLITPQIELNQLAEKIKIKGTWTLLSFANKNCNEICLDNVFKMQQIRQTQGEERSRVSRLLISNGKLPVADLQKLDEFRGTQFLRLDNDAYLSLLNIMSKNETDVINSLYLIDPLGYYMMEFPDSLVPKGIITDLRHLLKNSRIG